MISRFRAGAWVLAIVAAAIAMLAGCTVPSTRPVDPETGLRNFAKVSDALYRGGQPTEQGFVELKTMGVKTIVLLRTFDFDSWYLRGMGFKYFHISCKAPHPEEEDVVDFLKVVTDPANQPVFVHCSRGADRSGMMVAAYRIVVEGWDRRKAIEEMRSMGFDENLVMIERYIGRIDVDRLRESVARAPMPKLRVIR